jgi:hypothetical protein
MYIKENKGGKNTFGPTIGQQSILRLLDSRISRPVYMGRTRTHIFIRQVPISAGAKENKKKKINYIETENKPSCT